MNSTATATIAQDVYGKLAAAWTGRVVTNISAFNPAVPMVDVMLFNARGAMLVSKSYDAQLGAEAIAVQALEAAAVFA